MSRPEDPGDWYKAAVRRGLVGKTTGVNRDLFRTVDQCDRPPADLEAASAAFGKSVCEKLAGLPNIGELLADMTEEHFQQFVVGYAQANGWKVAHCRKARVSIGGVEAWRTPMGADGNGWPDLAMCHETRGVALFAEIKTEIRAELAGQ
jgi:hypothetical protein